MACLQLKFPLPCRAKPAAGGYPCKMRTHFAWGPGEGWGGVRDIVDNSEIQFFNCLLTSPQPPLSLDYQHTLKQPEKTHEKQNPC